MPDAVRSYDFLGPPTHEGDLGVLSHYRVLGEVGKGGMGYVFRAEDLKLKRVVALKVMNQKVASTPHSRRRFLHEARAMAAIHHDNVAIIYEVGESNQTPYMAMELLTGSTLEKYNRWENRLSYEKIITFARQMALGLSAAHVKGIVHRDIKPANIWIEEGSERVKILDFGLALASTPVDHLSGRGAVIGTPGYLSPEQARSEPLDDRSDLYSLGVVLYELCTGQLPLTSKTVPGQLIAILTHRPKPIQELNPDIPQPLCDLIHRLLRKEPRTRPSSAAKLVEELDRVEQECLGEAEIIEVVDGPEPSMFDSVLGLESSVPNPLATVSTPVIPPKKPTAQGRPDARSWQAYWPLAAIAALVLLALPVMTYLFSSQRRTESIVVQATGSENNAGVAGFRPNGNASNNATGVAPISSRQRNAQNQQTGRNNPSGGNQGGGVNQRGGQRGQGNQGRGGQAGQGRAGQGQAGQGQGRPKGQGRAQNQGQGKGQRQGQAKTGNQNRAAGGNGSGANRSNSPPKEGSTEPPNKQANQRKGAGENSANGNRAANNMDTPQTADRPTTDKGSDRVEDPKKQNSEPNIPYRWVTITTADGRGADVMVQNGSLEKRGANPSLGIGSRKGIDSHHSYLRFDLAPIEEVRESVRSAGLMLTAVRDVPEGAVIRVYGIPDLGMWPEQNLVWRNSFSVKGLHSFPSLAEVTVSENDIVRDSGGKSVVRISSPKFAEFIAGSKSDTITLVLTGSNSDSGVLRFISREGEVSKAPRLLVEVPEKPVPKADGQSNRQNGGGQANRSNANGNRSGGRGN